MTSRTWAKYALPALATKANKTIRGFVPFYKVPGDSYQNLRDWLKLHMEEEWGVNMCKLGIVNRIAKCPDLFSGGICFLMLGNECCRHDKYFQEFDVVHDVKLLLGTSTNTGVLIEGTNSRIIDQKDVSLTQDDLYFVIKQKLDYQQLTVYDDLDVIRYDGLKAVIDKHAWWREDPDRPADVFDWNDPDWKEMDQLQQYKHACRNMAQDSFMRWTGSGEKAEKMGSDSWKSRLGERPAHVRLKQITILDYRPPILTLRVESNGRLSPRTLTVLFQKLADIDCCLISSERIVFGPVQKDDCLLKHEMYFPELMEKSSEWTPQLFKWMYPYKKSMGYPVFERRMRF